MAPTFVLTSLTFSFSRAFVVITSFYTGERVQASSVFASRSVVSSSTCFRFSCLAIISSARVVATQLSTRSINSSAIAVGARLQVIKTEGSKIFNFVLVTLTVIKVQKQTVMFT